MYINPTECIDCGACEAACPTTALFVDYDNAGAAAENASYYNVGSPNTLEAELAPRGQL